MNNIMHNNVREFIASLHFRFSRAFEYKRKFRSRTGGVVFSPSKMNKYSETQKKALAALANVGNGIANCYLYGIKQTRVCGVSNAIIKRMVVCTLRWLLSSFGWISQKCSHHKKFDSFQNQATFAQIHWPRAGSLMILHRAHKYFSSKLKKFLPTVLLEQKKNSSKPPSLQVKATLIRINFFEKQNKTGIQVNR